MKKITLIISLAWAISQLPSQDLKALKAGSQIIINDKTVQLWATDKKEIIIIKEIQSRKEAQNEE